MFDEPVALPAKFTEIGFLHGKRLGHWGVKVRHGGRWHYCQYGGGNMWSASFAYGSEDFGHFGKIFALYKETNDQRMPSTNAST